MNGMSPVVTARFNLLESCPPPTPTGNARTKIRPAYAKKCAAGGTRASHGATRAEAHEPAFFAEDEVVQDLDTEDRAGGGEPASEGQVLGGWFGISGRVVVGEEYGGTAGEDRGLEHLARLCCGRGYVA